MKIHLSERPHTRLLRLFIHLTIITHEQINYFHGHLSAVLLCYCYLAIVYVFQSR